MSEPPPAAVAQSALSPGGAELSPRASLRVAQRDHMRRVVDDLFEQAVQEGTLLTEQAVPSPPASLPDLLGQAVPSPPAPLPDLLGQAAPSPPPSPPEGKLSTGMSLTSLRMLQRGSTEKLLSSLHLNKDITEALREEVGLSHMNYSRLAFKLIKMHYRYFTLCALFVLFTVFGAPDAQLDERGRMGASARLAWATAPR